jgi:hypothetical protein
MAAKGGERVKLAAIPPSPVPPAATTLKRPVLRLPAFRMSDEDRYQQPIGERCFLCEEALTPPWFKTGKFRMHTACSDLVCEDFEATHRRRLVTPKTANDNTRPMAGE